MNLLNCIGWCFAALLMLALVAMFIGGVIWVYDEKNKPTTSEDQQT